jgi:hypothetical protein
MTVVANPKPTYHGPIKLEGQADVKRGAVMITGAKATLLSYDVENPDDKEVAEQIAKERALGRRRKPQQVDVMRDIKVERIGDQLVITGDSLYHRRVLKLRDATATAKVDLRGCVDCG